MNTDSGHIYDLSNELQREQFEADDRAVEVSAKVAAAQIAGDLRKLRRLAAAEEKRERKRAAKRATDA